MREFLLSLHDTLFLVSFGLGLIGLVGFGIWFLLELRRTK